MHDNCYHAQTPAADALCEASANGICTYCHTDMSWDTDPGDATPVDSRGQLTCHDCYHDACGYGHDASSPRSECEQDG